MSKVKEMDKRENKIQKLDFKNGNEIPSTYGTTDNVNTTWVE